MQDLRRAGLRRVVEVAGNPSGYGSGYAIGDDLVLTAGHVVAGRESCAVRILGDAEAHTAEVVWTDPRPMGDAALLRVPSGPWRGEPDSGALRWGRVAGDQVGCVALGFPRVQEQAGGLRDIERVSGTTDASAAALLPRYEINVASAVPVRAAAGTSGWQGMSGAALFGPGRRLLGVVTADSQAYATGRLEAIPVQWLLADPSFAGLVGESVVSLEPVHRQAAVSELDDPAGLILAPPHQPLPAVHADYQLLQAKYGLVPFVGREGEIGTLSRWWRGPQRFGMAVVTGDAGAGKTRLGGQLCRIAAEAGWSAGFARIDGWDSALSNGGVVEVVWPTLIVVDYPDRLTPRIFEFLQAAMDRHRGPRLRVLLLDRTRDSPGPDSGTASLPDLVVWWRDLNRHSGGAARLHTQVVMRLQAGLLGPADRRAHALAAAEAFGGDASGAAALDLDEPGYANPLRIHLATLLRLRGRTAPDARHVVAQFLERERDRWTSRAAAHHVQEVSDVSMAQALALTTLTTPSVDECPDLLTAVPGLADPAGVWRDRRLRLTAWLHDLFPGDDDRIAALGPDLLAQQLLTETPGLPELALAIVDHSGHTATHLDRMIDILQLAGHEDARARQALQRLLAERLEAVLAGIEDDPQRPALLATAVGLCAEHGLAGDIGIAVAQLEWLPAATGSAAQLWKALAEAAVAALDAGGTDDVDTAVLLAGLLTDLVAYHSILNERAQALTRAREAHALLGRFDELASTTELGLVNLNLGTCMCRAGVDLAEAAHHLRDAVDLLADADFPEVRIDALLNLAACQADLRDRAAAARTYVEATAELDRAVGLGQGYTELGDMFRELSTRLDPETDEFDQPADPDAYRPPLGCVAEWLDLAGPTQQKYLQRLAGRLSAGAARLMPYARGDASARTYAENLRSIASFLAGAGQWAAACVPAAESAEMLRPFVSGEPDLRWQRGRNLRILAYYQRRAERTEAAIATAEAAIAEQRTFLAERPEARQRVWHPDDGAGANLANRAALPEIWLAGETLSLCLNEMGRFAEAAQARQQMAEALTELAALDPRYVSELADVMIGLSLSLAQINDPMRSAAAVGEAVGIYRTLAADDSRFEGELTEALKLASALAASTLYEDASSLTTVEELVERTRIAAEAEADPARWLEHASSLTAYSFALFSRGRYAEAETRARQADAIVLQVAEGPAVPMARAEALLALATCVLQLGRPPEVPPLIEQALALLPSVGDEDGSPDLLRCTMLSTVAAAWLAMFDVDDALAATVQAWELFEQLPPAARQGLIGAEIAGTRGRCHLLLEQPEEALAWTEMAVAGLEPHGATFVGSRMLAQLKSVIGVSLLQLGRAREAMAPLEQAVPTLAEMAEHDPTRIIEYAAALSALGNSHMVCEEPAAAHPYLQKAVAIFAELPPAQIVDIERASAEAFYSGALLMLGDPAGAVEHGGTAIALMDGSGAIPGRELLRAIVQQWVAASLAALGRADDAISAYGEAVDLLRPMDHTDVTVATHHAQCVLGVAELRLALGDSEQAERAALEARRIAAAEDGADPGAWPAELRSMYGAALVVQGQSRFSRGEPAIDLATAALEVLAAAPEVLPGRGPLIATAHGLQAAELAREGRELEAIEPALAAVAAFRPYLEDPNMRLRCASTGTLAGVCLLDHERFEEADPILAESVELFASLEEIPPGLVHEYATALANLAKCRWVDDDPREALELFAAGFDAMLATPGDLPMALHVRAVTGYEVAEAFAAVGALDEAATALRVSVEAHAALGHPYPELATAATELDQHLRSSRSGEGLG